MKKRGNWDLDEAESIKLAILTLQTVIGQEFKSNDIEIGVVSREHPLFAKLSAEKVEYYLNEVSKKDWIRFVCSNYSSILRIKLMLYYSNIIINIQIWKLYTELRQDSGVIWNYLYRNFAVFFLFHFLVFLGFVLVEL